MDNIIYTTPEEQIAKLKAQNLIIENEETAKKALSLFGYSNLIKSYREPYMHISNGIKSYRSGVTFNQIWSLYLLDKRLRNAVMASMLDLEEHIKEVAADVVAHSFGTHPNEYLKYSHYQNKKKRKYQFTLKGILETMNKTLKTDKNPIYHYEREHGIVPPWILFKSIYFTTINNFIDQFKAREKNEMVSRLYDIEVLNLSDESLRLLMMDSLFIFQDYRNLAAHGGRTYNYQSENGLRAEKIFPADANVDFTGFSQLIFLLELLKYKTPAKHLTAVLQNELSRHCKLYPQDITYLGQILNMDIVPKNIVYVANKSNKYHANPHCSGLQNAKKIDLNDAESNGYSACKKCALDIIKIV